MSLARLSRDQGKVQQARELLAPVYGWCRAGGAGAYRSVHSGGSTGQPVFYPRTADDLRYGELSRKGSTLAI